MALSIPIIFSHMYTLGRIPALRQRGFYFLFLSGSTEVLWTSDKGCHNLKKSPENLPVAVTCKGVIDRLPVSRSGDTSAMKPSVLGMILSLPMLLYPRKGPKPWIFQQGSLVRGRELVKRERTCERTWKNPSYDVAVSAKTGRVYGQSSSAGTVEY